MIVFVNIANGHSCNAGLIAEKVTPITERVGMARPVESQKATLPLLATANDVRELIRYLKKHPDGVTIVEALGEVKKRILDPRKTWARYEGAKGLVEQVDGLKKFAATGG